MACRECFDEDEDLVWSASRSDVNRKSSDVLGEAQVERRKEKHESDVGEQSWPKMLAKNQKVNGHDDDDHSKCAQQRDLGHDAMTRLA
jgi:hypothetical protein